MKRACACLGVLLVAASCWLTFSRGQVEELVLHSSVLTIWSENVVESSAPAAASLDVRAARPVTPEHDLQLPIMIDPANNESMAHSQEFTLPQPAQGYCAQTKDNDPGDCAGGLQGSWSTGLHGISSLAHCAVRCHKMDLALLPNYHALQCTYQVRCLGCARCRLVSYSQQFDDCSWFHRCSLRALQVKGPGRNFVTAQVHQVDADRWQQAAVRSQSVSSARFWRPQSDGALWAPGYCGPTFGRGDCETDERGSWDGRPSKDQAACEAMCRRCGRCNYVSFSLKHGDCSWYRTCDLRDLRRSPPSGLDYNTTRVSALTIAPVSSATVAAPRVGPSHRRAGVVRIAVVTLAGGAPMRCGVARWCQGARRLRAAIQGNAPEAWSFRFVAVVDQEDPHLTRDCPELETHFISAEMLRASRSCVQRLDDEDAVPRRSSAKGQWSRIINLCKWAVFAVAQVDLAFFTDLDADPLLDTESAGRVGELWRTMVPRFLASDLQIIATADSMAPVHGGVFIYKPSAAAYDDGLATIQRCVWNDTHGFDHVGRVRSLGFVPRHFDGEPIKPDRHGADVGDNQHPFTTDAFQRDDWGFWSASTDQGMLWYQLFLRPSGRGAYSRWSTAHKIPHEWGGNGKPWMRPSREQTQLSEMRIDQLAMRLRYLTHVELPFVESASKSTAALGSDTLGSGAHGSGTHGSGTPGSGAHGIVRPTPCTTQLWEMRRAIEEDPTLSLSLSTPKPKPKSKSKPAYP